MPTETTIAETSAPPPPGEGRAQFACESCGAVLSYAPGTTNLKCEYCGHENTIAEPEATVDELSFEDGLAAGTGHDDVLEAETVTCEACAAEFTLAEGVSSDACPFCGHNVVTEPQVHPMLKPGAVLPFALDAKAARERFRGWIKSLWFAPNDLVRFAKANDAFNGIYVPYWTFDCRTTSHYHGQRGTNYTTTETYTATENGKPVRKTRTVVRVRWTPVSGTVARAFDDVLVLASDKLPRTYTEKLEPWDLEALSPYTPAYLSGFRAERYCFGLREGFDFAKRIMDGVIRGDVKRDIGGDHQRIGRLSTRHDGITYKHILLPIWVAAYRYGGKPYRIVINGRTGEVQGERPYSWLKIGAVVLALAAIAGVAIYFLQ
jgi:LSD1 subclass zinc finger protein